MDWITIARAIHVVAVVHWIGGVAMVTLVILPAITRMTEPGRQLAMFQAIEGRFAGQAKISVTTVGLTGFYMVYRLDAWDRFIDPRYWWMHAMVALWALFTVVLFIAEPLFLHDRLSRPAEVDPAATFVFLLRPHRILLAVSAITVGAAVLGAHGL